MVTRKFLISWHKTIVVSFTIFIVLSLVFAFARGRFELYGLTWGMLIGSLFGAFPLMALGTRIEVNENEVRFCGGVLSLIFPKKCKSILLSSVREVRLGLPKINKGMSTFAAINISSEKDEITFNPDLFRKQTLMDLFRHLKNRAPNIRFDKYSQKMLERGVGHSELIGTVGKNFARSVVIVMIVGLIVLILYRVNIVSKDWLYPILGLQIIVLPIVVNRFQRS